MLTCNVIASGSKGNAVLVNGELLFDCGVSYKKIEPYVRNITMVFLTHIHKDHFNKATIKRLAKERPTLRFVCGVWMLEPLLEAGVPTWRIDLANERMTLNFGLLKAESVPLLHDVPNCGWKIFKQDEKAVYITDTANLDGIEAKDFDLYMVEANYREEELQRRMEEKLAAGKFSYEARAAESHLSKEQTDAWLLEQADLRHAKIVYLHQHKEH